MYCLSCGQFSSDRVLSALSEHQSLQVLRGLQSVYTYGVVKGKVSPLQAGVAQTVGRGIALLLHDCDTRRG